MKKTEKIIAAISTMLFGVLFLVLKGEMISVLMTVLGVALVVFGVMDLVFARVVAGVIKLVSALLVVLFGWVFVSAVLYLLGALVLIVGILTLYDLIKKRTPLCLRNWQSVLTYLRPVVCMLIGLLLFFNGFGWIFILAGLFTILLGGLWLFDVLLVD